MPPVWQNATQWLWCAVCVCVVESFQLFKSNAENFGWMNTLLNGIAHLNGVQCTLYTVYITRIQWASLCASVPVFNAHSETAKRQMYRIDTVQQCTNTPKIRLFRTFRSIEFEPTLPCATVSVVPCARNMHALRYLKGDIFRDPKSVRWLNWIKCLIGRFGAAFQAVFCCWNFMYVQTLSFAPDAKLAGFYSDQAPSHWGGKDVWLFVY